MKRGLGLVAAVLLAGSSALAVEQVDGGASGTTVSLFMHTCPRGFVVTGVHVDRNLLLCTGSYEFLLDHPPVVVQGTSSATPSPDVAPFPFDATAMHWCGPNRMVQGVHVNGNRFACQSFDATTTREMGPLGPAFLDRGDDPTVRASMHACPVGSVLIGAHFVSNTFLCAELPVCADNAQCGSGTTCVGRTPSSLFRSCQ